MALPGVKTILRDQSYVLTRTDAPATTTVAAIAGRTVAAGTTTELGATAVPDYDPFFPRSEREVIDHFGNGSGLHRAYIELIVGGAARVALIPLAADVTTAAELEATGEDSPFEKAMDAAEIAQADIIVPWGRGGHPSEWTNTAVTVDATANTFTATDHGLVAGDPVRFTATTLPAGLTADTTYYVRTAGLTEDVFTVSETGEDGTVVDMTTAGSDVRVADEAPFVGFAADNAEGGTSWVRRVADRCALITDRSHPCFAVLGITPAIHAGTDSRPNGNLTPTDLADHLGLDDLVGRNDAAMGDNGGYVSVVGTEMTLNRYKPEWGYSNGAAVYAGHISSIDGWVSTTGKTVFNVTGLRYIPTRSQQEAMIALGVVPVSQNFNRIATWVDGLTYAHEGSDYTRLSTLRIIFDAAQVVRQVAQRFVGEPATLHHRNALETAITSGLNAMVKRGSLLGADFVITYVPRENKAIIDLVLAPAFELRNIEISIAVQL